MLELRGQVRETRVFGNDLVLSRRITARVGESRLCIEDTVENPGLAGGLALRVRFRPEELPEFVQWTMTGEGTYVLGLEPATCRLQGYPAEREAGRVIDLQPGEVRRFRVEIGVEVVQG